MEALQALRDPHGQMEPMSELIDKFRPFMREPPSMSSHLPYRWVTVPCHLPCEKGF